MSVRLLWRTATTSAIGGLEYKDWLQESGLRLILPQFFWWELLPGCFWASPRVRGGWLAAPSFVICLVPSSPHLSGLHLPLPVLREDINAKMPVVKEFTLMSKKGREVVVRNYSSLNVTSCHKGPKCEKKNRGICSSTKLGKGQKIASVGWLMDLPQIRLWLRLRGRLYSR